MFILTLFWYFNYE